MLKDLESLTLGAVPFWPTYDSDAMIQVLNGDFFFAFQFPLIEVA